MFVLPLFLSLAASLAAQSTAAQTALSIRRAAALLSDYTALPESHEAWNYMVAFFDKQLAR